MVLFLFKKVEMAFGPCVAYLIDVMRSRSSESLAANKYADALEFKNPQSEF